MQETRVRSVGREGPLEKEMAIHSSILPWRFPWTERSLAGYIVHGVARVGHDLVTTPPPPINHLFGFFSPTYWVSVVQ